MNQENIKTQKKDKLENILDVLNNMLTDTLQRGENIQELKKIKVKNTSLIQVFADNIDIFSENMIFSFFSDVHKSIVISFFSQICSFIYRLLLWPPPLPPQHRIGAGTHAWKWPKGHLVSERAAWVGATILAGCMSGALESAGDKRACFGPVGLLCAGARTLFQCVCFRGSVCNLVQCVCFFPVRALYGCASAFVPTRLHLRPPQNRTR